MLRTSKANTKEKALKPKPDRRSLPIPNEIYGRIEAVRDNYFKGRAVYRIVESILSDVLEMIEHPEAVRAYPRIVEEFDLLQKRRQSPRSAANGITEAESGGEK